MSNCPFTEVEMNNIAVNLKNFRTYYDLSAAIVAYDIGISKTTYYKYETTGKISRELLNKFCMYYEVEPSFMLGPWVNICRYCFWGY